MTSLETLQSGADSLSAEDRQSLLTYLSQAAGPSPSQPPSQPQPSQSSQFLRKLRNFSGKKPVPAGEVDFETWSLQAKQVLEEDINEVSKKRCLTNSLLRPAIDICLNIDTSQQIFETLKIVFGRVADGRELYVQFLSKFQESKETSSEYLQRLYLELLTIEERRGITADSLPKELLQQFIRGSRDENLIFRLKLEEKTDDPPSFADLLLSIRKEETRCNEKKTRLGTNARAASQTTSEESTLKAQVKLLTEKIEKMEAKSKPVTRKDKDTKSKVFCYNCGYDGHKNKTCRKSPNPQLVQKKLLQRSQQATPDKGSSTHTEQQSRVHSN